MKGVDTLGLAPDFDGTGYPRWKVLMEAYLQAKDLDVWRVTDEGMKNGTKKEKQFDVIAKSIILSSQNVGVFNRVFNCTKFGVLVVRHKISSNFGIHCFPWKRR
jgi:hypothetical protein